MPARNAGTPCSPRQPLEALHVLRRTGDDHPRPILAIQQAESAGTPAHTPPRSHSAANPSAAYAPPIAASASATRRPPSEQSCAECRSTLAPRRGDQESLEPSFRVEVHCCRPTADEVAKLRPIRRSAERAARLTQDDDCITSRGEVTRDSVRRILEQPHHADGRRRIDGTRRALIVERDIAAGHRRIERAAGVRNATARLDDVRPLHLDEVQGIIYTSGTTGFPKGAMLTYGNHWWNAIGSGLNLGGHGGDVWLAAVPLFHVSGLSIVMRGLIHGFAVLLHERFDPAAVNQAIDEEGVTLLSVVSAMLDRMLLERAGRPYPPSLRAVLVGGGPVPEALLKKALDHGMQVLQTYGMTETASQAATLSPHDALRKLGSAGKPLFHVEMRVDAPRGEIGEILVRGPSVSPGYYRRPDESLASRREGWFCTGDLGFVDDEGYLYVVDRRTDLIISGGENVYPAELEALLHSHPAVREAGVAPKADAAWGQVPVAFVVAKSEPTAQLATELIEYCRSNLASYKAPAEVHFVPELPRNAAGKVARHRLAELLASESEDLQGES